MFWALLVLSIFNTILFVGGWIVYKRIVTHLRHHPEAAKLIAEHIIAPLLTGGKEPNAENKPQSTNIKGKLV